MKYYLTTPIYYVNDLPHIGHAYTTIAADVTARWKRLCGDDVFFLTGTDEHGAKICQAAAKTNSTPAEFCDRISGEFRKEWQNLKITNDYFVRTTDPKHEKAVQKFLGDLQKTGAIEKGKYEGLYCVGCEKFLTEADLVDGCCPDHKQKPVLQSEENWFFKLSGYQEELLKIISDDSDPRIKIFPIERRNEIVGKLKAMKLENISISRANLEWGVPLPFDPKQTAYVWVDALLNYITAIGYGEDSEEFKKLWPADLHLMAKDILWFHSVIWPAMLLAMKLPLPKKIFAHGFFTINGDKMSKTLGNVILPKEMTDKFGVDAARYLTLSLFPFGSDGDISWQALTDKYNTDLANNLGNLVNRTLDMLVKFSDNKIPFRENNSAPIEITQNILLKLSPNYELLDKLDFFRCVGNIQSAIDMANRFIQEKAPWKLAKEKSPELSTVIFTLAANLKMITAFIAPFMPQTSEAIWKQLGETDLIENFIHSVYSGWNKHLLEPHHSIYPISGADLPKSGNVVNKGGILFPRIVEKK